MLYFPIRIVIDWLSKSRFRVHLLFELRLPQYKDLLSLPNFKRPPSPSSLDLYFASNFSAGLFHNMKWTYENFPLFHPRKSTSRANLERHQIESLQPCDPTYDRQPTRDPVTLRPGTPRPHRYADPQLDFYQPPIIPSRQRRPLHPYAPRPTPYGGRPARYTRRYEDEDDLITRVGNCSEHPDYRKDVSKTIHERATHRLSKLHGTFGHPRPKLPCPSHSESRPKQSESRPSWLSRVTLPTERAKDTLIVNDHYGSLTQYQPKEEPSLEANRNVSLVTCILLPPLISC